MFNVREGQSKGEFPFPLVKYLLFRSSPAPPVKYLLSEFKSKVRHAAVHGVTVSAGQVGVTSPKFYSLFNPLALCVHGGKIA